MNIELLTLRSRTDAPTSLQATVLYFARLGDSVMLTAMLTLLHRRYGKPCHVVGVGDWTTAVFENTPDVGKVSVFNRHFPFPLTPGWSRVARELRESHPGPIYICERHYRQLPRIRRMLALSRVDPKRCVFMTEEVETLHHSVDRTIRLAERTPGAVSAGDYPIPVNVAGWAPRLRVAAHETVEVKNWLAGRGWSGRPIVLLQPGNHRSMGSKRHRWARKGTDNKAWPTERWVSLLHRMHAFMPEALLMLCGAPVEETMLQKLKSDAGLESVELAVVGLRRLFALCEIAHSMVSVDTGPAHAAAALGLPLVVMFGAAQQRYWLPRSSCGSPVLGIGGPPESRSVSELSSRRVFEAWTSLAAVNARMQLRRS